MTRVAKELGEQEAQGSQYPLASDEQQRRWPDFVWGWPDEQEDDLSDDAGSNAAVGTRDDDPT
jgi:hypothetical protein